MLAIVPSLAIATALGACNPQVSDGAETADDFAARLGTSGSAAEGAAAPMASEAVAMAPPANGDALQLQRLGDVKAVDLGPRAGACAFRAEGAELLAAAAPADRAMPGKAAVRIGGRLLLLDGEPGGYAGIRDGTVFRGEGFSAELTPGRGDAARLTLADARGETRVIEGRWACT